MCAHLSQRKLQDGHGPNQEVPITCRPQPRMLRTDLVLRSPWRGLDTLWISALWPAHAPATRALKVPGAACGEDSSKFGGPHVERIAKWIAESGMTPTSS